MHVPSQPQEGANEAGRPTPCRVCLKPMAAGEPKWTVHYRGAQYLVCCPSCVQLFNRTPQQSVEQD